MESSSSPPQPKPIILQKPPGYRDPNTVQKPLPPRKAALPPSFRPKPKKRRCCRKCCCTFCIILLLLILVLVVAVAVIYILYQPSLPEFHIGSFRVSMFNITVNDDVAYLNANTTTRVELKNRNKKIAWHFDQSNVHILAENGDLNLGSTKVAPFDVKVRNTTQLKVETKVRGVELDARQRRRLKSVFDSKALKPRVEVKTRTGMKVQGWNSMKMDVTVVCDGVTLRQLQNGVSPHCSLTILKWIKIR